jgi:hypothetical protein
VTNNIKVFQLGIVNVVTEEEDARGDIEPAKAGKEVFDVENVVW